MAHQNQAIPPALPPPIFQRKIQSRPIVLIDPIMMMSEHTLWHASRQHSHIMIGRYLVQNIQQEAGSP